MFKISKFLLVLFFSLIVSDVKAEVIKDIEVYGNKRISKETIKMFSKTDIGQKITDENLNDILKNIYDSSFFKNVTVEINKQILEINVEENPIIENIKYSGVKANKILELIKKNRNLQSRSSYNDFLLKEDKENILLILKDIGYYFATVNTYISELEDNKVNINFEISLGEKSKIKKISFIGNKIFKNKKLRSLIISEEYKFWKFISGKKFLNENIISFDERLLKNFYLNKGYYNVEINSSFAKMINKNEFELIFNINPYSKIYFNNLSLNLPNDFEVQSYSKLQKFFQKIKGEPYSLLKVENILEEIEYITINDQNLSVRATIDEKVDGNKLDIVFNVEEVEKYYVKKINILGNSITQESVIRNNFEIDEGDPFNEILNNKTKNNLRNLNFFKKVDFEILTDDVQKTKEINISVKEKPTGEIFAGAGAGTDGGSISLGIKENNYLGKGLKVKADGTLTEESFKGQFSVTNPNYKNSDKSIFLNLQALEVDKLKTSGYKNNKTGFDVGTGFEFFDDLFLNLSTRTYIEKIETNSTASTKLKKQEGNYFDSFINVNLDLDKRNQKFKTTRGYRSSYMTDIPILSESYTFTNTYYYKYFTELYDENISSFTFYISAANSISGDDVKLSERLFVPTTRLRGFEKGKVGPKDGKDFIGGNYVSSINFSSSIPQVLPNLQEIDFLVFFDAANVWGVDYSSALDDGSKIRSSIGIGIDWYTVVGPINFTFAEALSKSDTDITETFRFNIGTTF